MKGCLDALKTILLAKREAELYMVVFLSESSIRLASPTSEVENQGNVDFNNQQENSALVVQYFRSVCVN